MRVAILLLLLIRVAAADPRATVDALPEIAKVTRGRSTVIVRGAISKAKQKEMISFVEQVIDDTHRRFGIAKGDPHPPVTLCLFPDLASYNKVAGEFGPVPSEWGFYLPSVRIAFANVGASVGNLRHELAHPMIDDDYPAIPAWLSEGVGALYGTAIWRGSKFEFVVNYRVRDLQKAIKDGTLPSIAALAASTTNEVHGATAGIYYAYARYVLLYVEQKGQLSRLYEELRAAKKAAHAEILGRYVDDQAFVAWAKKLRY